MSYERKCDECIFDHPFSSCCQAPIPDCGFAQRPATPDELRAELLERCEVMDGWFTDPWRWHMAIEVHDGMVVPCIRREGDDL